MRCAFALAIAVITGTGISPAFAAEPAATATYERGYELGYYDGYDRGYRDAYQAAYEAATRASLQRPDRSDARRNGTAKRVERTPAVRHTRVAARIESTVYAAATDAGVPNDVVAELIRLFSYQVDFSRDVQPGDRFEVVFDTREGGAADSRVLLASITLSGETQTLYRFQSRAETEYFDAQGRSAMGMLMRTPVDGAQVSSVFGRRHNAVHEGIDFRVPPGTPVMAAGSGEVTFVGRSRGYGNLLVIEHGNGYSTAYAHLSRFASGLREGMRVRQGEVVAQSGATGNATGPHLHYEIRLDGRAVNPARVKEVFGRTLSGDELARFAIERGKLDQLAASLPVRSNVAQSSRRPPEGG